MSESVDPRYTGGAMWRSPSYLVVQLVMLGHDADAGEVMWVLNGGGLTHTEPTGKMYYRSSELPARLAGWRYVGHTEEWLWSQLASTIEQNEQEKAEMAERTGNPK